MSAAQLFDETKRAVASGVAVEHTSLGELLACARAAQQAIQSLVEHVRATNVDVLDLEVRKIRIFCFMNSWFLFHVLF